MKRITLILFVIFFAGIFISFGIFLTRNKKNPSNLPLNPIFKTHQQTKALILYDEDPQEDLGSLYSVILANLLGHFNVDYKIEPVTAYADGQIQGFDYIFYIGSVKDAYIPKSFFDELYKSGKTVVWFQDNLNQLQGNADFDFLKRFGFCFTRSIDSPELAKNQNPPNFFDLYFYKDKKLFRQEITGIPKTISGLSIVKAKIIDPSIAKVRCTVENPDTGENMPYIIQSKNIWFVADIPFAFLELKDRYFIFSDILHDILKKNHPAKLTALLRIEDVNPSTNPNELKSVVNFLEEKKIPFSIGVVPFFIDPIGNQYGRPVELTFSDSPEVLEILKKAQESGASIIMHGTTHQQRNVKDKTLTVTTIGYEFWDSENNTPIENDSVEFVKNRLEKGKAEFARQGLNPAAFEVPHYMASALDYRVFAKEFAFNYHEPTYHLYDTTKIPLTAENLKKYYRYQIQQVFPYVIYRDYYGQFLIPASVIESIDYEDAKDASLLEKKLNFILKQVQALTVVRDGCASFYIHPFVIKAMSQHGMNGFAALAEIIDEIKKAGFIFIDVKSIGREK